MNVKRKYHYKRVDDGIPYGVWYAIYFGDDRYEIYKLSQNSQWSRITVNFRSEKKARAYVAMKNKFLLRSRRWARIWEAATANMPVRRAVTVTRMLLPLEEALPIGEYIKGTVGKKPKYHLIDGIVHELHIQTNEYSYGRRPALARLLGYKNKKGEVKATVQKVEEMEGF